MMRKTKISYFHKKIKVFGPKFNYMFFSYLFIKSVFASVLSCFLLINNVNAELIIPQPPPNSTTHFMRFDIFPDRVSAYDACVNMAVSLGWASPYCHSHTSNPLNDREFEGSFGVMEAGWVVQGGLPFYLIEYMYPLYYVSSGNNNITGCEGNPCDPATGKKFQSEVDYSSVNGSLTFNRYYHSQNSHDQFDSFGFFWRHNFSSRIEKNEYPHRYAEKVGKQSSYYSSEIEACENGWGQIKTEAYRGLLSTAVAAYHEGVCQLKINENVKANLTIEPTVGVPIGNRNNTKLITLTRSDGTVFKFRQQLGIWVNLENVPVKLTNITTGWQYTDLDNTVALYNVDGKITSSTTIQGRTTTYSYHKNGSLDTVTDPNGRSLVFTYDSSNLITSVTTPQGIISYRYDENNNLEYVDYSDGTTRQYHYENINYPHHLTGITDEKGKRFASWAYHPDGKVASSEHAGGAEKVTFVYNANGTTTVNGALGEIRTYHFTIQNGALRVSNITGDECRTCGNGYMKERTYDSNGYLSSYTDWQGNITTYTHDATGLELSRTEASGTPEARTITTEWHSDYRLPIKVTHAGKVTDYSYDSQGRLLSQTTRSAQ